MTARGRTIEGTEVDAQTGQAISKGVVLFIWYKTKRGVGGCAFSENQNELMLASNYVSCECLSNDFRWIVR